MPDEVKDTQKGTPLWLSQRSLSLAVLAILVAGGYALLVTGISLVTNRAFLVKNPVLAGSVFFLVALLFYPLRNLLEARVNRTFFRGRVVYQELLAQNSAELTGVVELASIAAVLRQNIEKTFSPKSSIFISTTPARKNSWLRSMRTAGLPATCALPVTAPWLIFWLNLLQQSN